MLIPTIYWNIDKYVDKLRDGSVDKEAKQRDGRTFYL